MRSLGRPVEPKVYFGDLYTASVLLRPPPPAAHDPAIWTTRRRDDHHLPHQPADAAQVLTAAHLLLALDTGPAEQKISGLLSETCRDQNRWKALARTHDVSPSMRNLIHQADARHQLRLRTYNRASTVRNVDIPPISPRAFTWRNVPQMLPETWLRQHFDVPCATWPALRQALPIHLIQMITGATQQHSAELLGLPRSTGDSLLFEARRRVTAIGAADEVRAGLRRLADHLNRQPDPVDYHRRRRALATWTLPQGRWDARARLPALRRRRAPRGGHRTDLGRHHAEPPPPGPARPRPCPGP
ncbi:hypothetical protein [Kitasatospora sp. MMS16-BH015]|uniref:hypothetical protein n=1 Tax=Kitasatospora sp. MMS16-BH015 TaxID=2018025 RepID=UPI00131A54B2|nr:hypothetical protein [Kitasatospora sp. MMS16-BH015]